LIEIVGGTQIDTGVFVLLPIISLIAGVFAGSIGAGGILFVATLYITTGLSPSTIAGTSSSIFIPGSVAATAAYARSGDMDWVLALVLGVGALVGTNLGTQLNLLLHPDEFRLVLALSLWLTGGIILYREYHGISVSRVVSTDSLGGIITFGTGGVVIGISGGLFGVGGPLFSVPFLLVLGVPLLISVAVSQAFAVFVTVSTTANYLALGAVDGLLALTNGPFFLIGIVIGWKVAHTVDHLWLKIILSLVIIATGVQLLL
jgi:uncharacterized membrane protein YfcA